MRVGPCIVKHSLGQWSDSPICDLEELIKLDVQEFVAEGLKRHKIYMSRCTWWSFWISLGLKQLWQFLNLLESSSRIKYIYNHDIKIACQKLKVRIATMKNFDNWRVLEDSFESFSNMLFYSQNINYIIFLRCWKL